MATLIMRAIFFFSLLVSFSAQAAVDLRISKMHGFYNFLETIGHKPHHADLILKAYEESPYHTPENQKWIDAIQTAEESMPGFNFNGYPASRTAGSDLEQLLSIQSIFSKDLNEFSTRTLGLMPTADHAKFFEAAKVLLPIYEKLIWNPSLTQLLAYRVKLIKLAKKTNLDSMFTKASHFYRGNWPKNEPFVIALYPTPGSRGSTSSESLGAAESVGVLLGGDSPEETYGVMFHELCHSLYKSQTIEFQIELEKMFTSSPSPYAYRAYRLLNEGLATSLGNGWAYELANHKPDVSSWYNNHYIDGFAKAIDPLVREYLKADRAIDAEFAQKSIALLESKLPEALTDYENLFQWIVVLVDGEMIQSRNVRTPFRQMFRVNTWSSHDPINQSEGLSAASFSQNTLLVAYAKSERNQLDGLAEKIPFVKEQLKVLKAENRNYIFSKLDSKGRAMIFIQVSAVSDLPKALEQIKKNKRIDPSQPFSFF